MPLLKSSNWNYLSFEMFYIRKGNNQWVLTFDLFVTIQVMLWEAHSFIGVKQTVPTYPILSFEMATKLSSSLKFVPSISLNVIELKLFIQRM